MNEEIAKIQAKVKIAYRQMQDNNQRNECALMRINNFRDNRPEDMNTSEHSISYDHI